MSCRTASFANGVFGWEHKTIAYYRSRGWNAETVTIFRAQGRRYLTLNLPKE